MLSQNVTDGAMQESDSPHPRLCNGLVTFLVVRSMPCFFSQTLEEHHLSAPGCAAAIASEHYVDSITLIHAHRVKHALANVDPEHAHRWLHWTRLLWRHGFTDFELIVAHRSRSARGRSIS
jgi:hypothetical protein